MTPEEFRAAADALAQQARALAEQAERVGAEAVNLTQALATPAATHGGGGALVLGLTVLVLAIFVVPLSFVLVMRLCSKRRSEPPKTGKPDDAPEPAPAG